MIKLFDLKINYNCNNNCTHCFIANRRDTDNLNFEKISTIINKLELEQNITVIITGGEPTIHPEFIKIIKYIKMKGFQILLQTNGMRFSNIEFATEVTPYLDYIMFNLNSHIPEIHNKIVRSTEYENAWQAAIQGLNNLYNLKANVTTQTVISKTNLHTLPKTYDFIQEKFPGILMYMTFPHTIGNVINEKNLFVTYTEAHEIINKVMAKWYNKIISVYIPNCFLYPYQYSKKYINVNDFEYNDQVFIHYGYDQSLNDEYFKNNVISNYVQNTINTSIKSEKCKKCIFDKTCVGVRQEYYDLFGFIDVTPIKELNNKHYFKKYFDNKIVPLQGSTKELHNKLTITDFESNLEIIRNNNITGLTNVNKYNKNDLSAIYNLYVKNSKKIDKYIVTINPNGKYNLNLKDLKLYLFKFISNSYDLRGKIFINIYDIPYCVFGEYHHFINNNNPQTAKFKTRIEQCKSCIYTNLCDGVFKEEVEKYTDIKAIKKIVTSEIYIKEDKIKLLKNIFPNKDLNKMAKVYLKTHSSEELETFVDKTLRSNELSFYTLRVGYDCNNYCIHCFVEDKRYEGGNKTLKELKLAIDEITYENTAVIVTGGEPTLRDDLVELLKYINNKGFLNIVQTNGLKFYDMNYLNSVAKYIETVVLPIHSSDKDIFNKITRVEDSYDKIIQGFKNLIKLEMHVTTQTVINQLNYKTLLETYDMIQDMCPGTNMTLTFPHPIAAAATTKVTPSFSDIAKYIKPVVKKYGHLMHTHYIPKCLLYPYHNSVVVIDETDDNNTEKPGIDYIHGKWVNTDYGKFADGARVKSEECKKCIFNDECVGVWRKYNELYPLDMIPITEDIN